MTSVPDANPRLGRVMREAGWILVLAAGVYLALVLASYYPTDPGPQYSGPEAQVMNRGGVLGAWIAGTLFFAFGFSAWWWVAFAAAAILRLYRRVEAWELVNRRSAAAMLVGFAVVLAASCTLEALRLHALVPSAFEPGGVLGTVLAGFAGSAFGFTGATLLLLALVAGGVSLFTGLSWLRATELPAPASSGATRRRGGASRRAATARKAASRPRSGRKRSRWPRRPSRSTSRSASRCPRSRSRRASASCARSRCRCSPTCPTRRCRRCNLLDAPETHVERPPPETLEYTSRLIERKLQDFGVEVKVVAAYPGPVITRYEIEPAVGVKGSQIVNLVKDLARALSVVAIRVVETIPGKSCMGLEIPNPKRADRAPVGDPGFRRSTPTCTRR